MLQCVTFVFPGKTGHFCLAVSQQAFGHLALRRVGGAQN